MTDIRTIVAELRELEAKATPRKGTYYFMGDDCSEGMCSVSLDDAHPGLEGCYAPICDAHTEFIGKYIAGSLNALPQLLDYIAKLEAVAREAKDLYVELKDETLDHKWDYMLDALDALDELACDD